jgi:hypothetical protein
MYQPPFQLLAARLCASVFQQITDTNTEYDRTNQNISMVKITAMHLSLNLPYFTVDNARVIYTSKGQNS